MKKSIMALLVLVVIIIAAIPFVLKWTTKEPLPSIATTDLPLVSGNPTRPISTNGADTIYVRTNGSWDFGYPKTTVICSAVELTAYYEEHKAEFDLERREEGDGFLDACDAFDDAYFAEHILVLVTMQEGSGSIHHEVKRVAMTENRRLEIDVESIHPNMQTADMAQWHLFVKPASNVRAEDIDEVVVNRSVRYLVDERSVSENLMEGIEPRTVVTADRGINGQAVTPFAVQLLKYRNKQNANTLVSPLSVLSALAMTANGADGETRRQLETAFGMTVEEINEYLLLYRRTLLTDKSKPVLALANAIWFDNCKGLAIQPSFLQTNADYFGAEIYKAPFSDIFTTRDINNWVTKHTNGLVTQMLREMPKNTVMCLLNAVAFDDEWEDPYEERQVRDGVFTTEDGAERPAVMMYSGEDAYLEDDRTTGFVKYYRNRKYAFAALLPNEGIAIDDYVASLTGERLYALLSTPQKINVHATLPQFDIGCRTDLSDVLRTMGVTDALDGEKADFSKLGSYTGGNLYLGKVLHEARMQVYELGTRAGAATAVMLDAGSAIVEYREVTLDRPFVYVLFDCETKLPIFLGLMKDISIS